MGTSTSGYEYEWVQVRVGTNTHFSPTILQSFFRRVMGKNCFCFYYIKFSINTNEMKCFYSYYGKGGIILGGIILGGIILGGIILGGIILGGIILGGLIVKIKKTTTLECEESRVNYRGNDVCVGRFIYLI